MTRPHRPRVQRRQRPVRPVHEAGTLTPGLIPGFTSVPGSAVPGLATPGYPAYTAVTPPAPPVTGLVQSIAGTSYGEYGLHAVEIDTTAGNGLVVFAGWDRNFSPSPAPVPAVYVSDSAGNRWYHLATSDAGNSGARCAIWVCPNARATGSGGLGWVSVSLTGFAASLAYLVCEFSNMPDLSVTDVAVTSTAQVHTAGAITAAGTASQAGFGFSMACSGSAGTSLTTPPAGWDALTTVSAGGSAPDGVKIFPFVQPAVSAGNITAAYNVSGTPPLAAALATIEASPAAPVQPNPNFPVLAVELGLGTLPGDVSAQPPVWTDVTLQTLGKEDDQFISVDYGREYELATPEAGEMTIGLNNLNGQFTPGNVMSPFWSNALSLNPGFVTSVINGAGNQRVTGTTAGWSALNNAMLGVQQGYAYADGWSASLAPDGVTASPGLAVAAAATGSRDYCASAWCLFPVAWAGGVQALIGWYSGASLLATTTGAVTDVPAGQWTQVSVRASAHPGATSAVAYFQYSGVPAATLVSYWDVAGLCPGGQTVQTGLRDLTPVRVSAYWAGSWYDVASQYVQAWPVEMPDLPQYGLSKMKAADALAVMASCTMPSAAQGQILIDNPYTYLPFNEQYLTQTAGLTATTTTLTSYQFSEAQGLQAANLARFNQRSGMYVDGGGQQVQTGLALNLLGDQGTGMGTSAYSGTQGPGAGPGVIYADPALPSPGNAAGQNGVTAECWFVQDDSNTPSLMAAYANPSPYAPSVLPPVAATPGLLGAAWMIQAGGTAPLGTLTAYFPFTGLTANYTPSAAAQHVALVLTPQSGGASWTVALWLNGQLGASVTLSSSRLLGWNALTFAEARYGFGQAPGRGNLVLGHGAVTAAALSPSRIAAHYNTGIFGTVSGQAGDTPQQRVASILAWGLLGVPRGGPLTFQGATENVLIGPAYSVGGSTATDAVGVVTTSEGGLATTMPNGYLTYLPRWWLYNLPSTVTFGDNSQGGEVPFERGQAFDLDTTYLYNQAAVTRVDGPTTSVTATWRDLAAGERYYTRSALTQQIETTSDYDAYDASTWLTGKYKDPVVRVRTMTINAASNPVQAFPAVLTTRVSTVATVNRRPIGGAQVSALVQTQKVSHRIGAASWKTVYQQSPYNPESAVLQADNPPFDVLGNVLALPR